MCIYVPKTTVMEFFISLGSQPSRWDFNAWTGHTPTMLEIFCWGSQSLQFFLVSNLYCLEVSDEAALVTIMLTLLKASVNHFSVPALIKTHDSTPAFRFPTYKHIIIDGWIFSYFGTIVKCSLLWLQHCCVWTLYLHGGSKKKEYI